MSSLTGSIARRPIGTTGLQASALGFGTGDNAGLMVLGSSADQRNAVAAAIAAGMNYFDTSPDYGRGRAEENLGRALKGRRGEVLITTKVEIMPADRHRLAKKVIESIDQSLRRLRTNHVDILMLGADSRAMPTNTGAKSNPRPNS
ncbi:MAG: aldo/keto reductase [Burkholderiales bacterium]